jgi:hypothetical protein
VVAESVVDASDDVSEDVSDEVSGDVVDDVSAASEVVEDADVAPWT